MNEPWMSVCWMLGGWIRVVPEGMSLEEFGMPWDIAF